LTGHGNNSSWNTNAKDYDISRSKSFCESRWEIVNSLGEEFMWNYNPSWKPCQTDRPFHRLLPGSRGRDVARSNLDMTMAIAKKIKLCVLRFFRDLCNLLTRQDHHILSTETGMDSRFFREPHIGRWHRDSTRGARQTSRVSTLRAILRMSLLHGTYSFGE